jgi:hypothetical protein
MGITTWYDLHHLLLVTATDTFDIIYLSFEQLAMNKTDQKNYAIASVGFFVFLVLLALAVTILTFISL